MTFSQFYQQGGVFMHLITLCVIGGVVSIALRTRDARRTMVAPHRPTALDGGTTPWLIAAGLMFGVAGTLMGVIELGAALRTIPLESWPIALSRGGQITVYPLTWAMLAFAPLVLVHGALRHFERRMRAALDRRATTVTPDAG